MRDGGERGNRDGVGTHGLHRLLQTYDVTLFLERSQIGRLVQYNRENAY